MDHDRTVAYGREHGYPIVNYVGRYRDFNVYDIGRADGRRRRTGPPKFILESESDVRFTTVDEGLEIVSMDSKEFELPRID